ncbi:hypothetical protein MUU46_18525 [Scandinavium sp. TWS1a]|uniref:hypothetical protein n=1 Tax=Scandinavium tedordense TaxID=2926521 RepID=UPI00216595B2|nr:hypothetical protein [Scandinavium tedordense]MCS2172285.1 hypothetical protein [Scandinavium tedordense]
MSVIRLAAQRSAATGEAVYFTRRLPDLRQWLLKGIFWLICLVTLVTAGFYAHLYWQCRHPGPPSSVKKVGKQDVILSDMHYVYVTKAFPPPTPVPVPQTATPASQNKVSDRTDDDDWKHTPDGSLATQLLPGSGDNSSLPISSTSQPAVNSPSLEERLLQAIKEQQQDYAQGKIPDVTPQDDLSITQPASSGTADLISAPQSLGRNKSAGKYMGSPTT